MPIRIQARVARDAAEEGIVRKLAASRHGPANVIRRAQMIVKRWEGKNTKTIADELGCHAKTVRVRVARFNALGIDGLQDGPGRGRKARLTEAERSTIVGLIGQTPPGRLVRERDGELYVTDAQGEAHWSLDALARVAKGVAFALDVARSAAFFCMKASPGGAPVPGRRAVILTLSQKDRGRHALHPTAVE